MIPWKTVIFVLLILLLTVYGAFFIGFNLDFQSPVSVVFHTYESVPVLLIVLSAFIGGFLFSTLLFLLGMTGRFFREHKKIRAEKRKLKQEKALAEKTAAAPKVNGLPRYDA